MLKLFFPEARVAARALRSGPASGLFPARVHVRLRSERPHKLVLKSADGRPLGYERAIAPRARPDLIELNLNTHLLPNGRQRIVAAVEDLSGRVAARGSFDLDVSNRGPVAERVRESLRSRDAPIAVEGPLDSSLYDIANAELQPWFDSPNAAAHLAARAAGGGLTGEEAAVLGHFVHRGYAVLPMKVEEALLARLDKDLDHAVRRRVDGYVYGSSQRIRNLHLRYASFEALWRHPRILRWLELLFEVPARPAQTLTYVFGSEQDPHQDTIHLTPFPAGYMCGVWVALEDVRPDSGELVLHAGSHRLPRLYMQGSGCAKVTGDDWSDFGAKIVSRWAEMVCDAPFERVFYRPRRGEVLVWHENLMHGGSRRLDKSLTRRSVVSHYFGDGAIAFYDSSGMPGTLA